MFTIRTNGCVLFQLWIKMLLFLLIRYVHLLNNRSERLVNAPLCRLKVSVIDGFPWLPFLR